MLINDPETLASVTAAFEAYEHALMTNDIDALDALFWPSEFTVRIGPGQNLYGIAAIQAFRTARDEIGRAHVSPVTNAHLVCSHLPEKKKTKDTNNSYKTY